MIPVLGKRLYLHLCRYRRIARLDRRLEPDPQVFALVVRRGGCGAGRAMRSATAPACLGGVPIALSQGPEAGRNHQPARHLHHRGRRRPADLQDEGGATLNAALVAVKVIALGIVFVAVFLLISSAIISTRSCLMAFPGSGAPGAEVGSHGPRPRSSSSPFTVFDAVATAAEETKNPGRDLKISIVGSMLIVIIYMALAGARSTLPATATS